jgi:hypothetical protein
MTVWLFVTIAIGQSMISESYIDVCYLYILSPSYTAE